MNKQSGQSMAEYGLILALIAIVAIAVIARFGKNITEKFGSASTCLEQSTTVAAGGQAVDNNGVSCQ